MGKARIFMADAEILSMDAGEWVALPPELVRYAVRVLRSAPGERLVLRDRKGRAREAVLTLEDEVWGAQLGACFELVVPPSREVWLVPPLIKGARFDWMVEKAAELGAQVIAPFSAQRAVVRWSPQKVASKVARLQRVSDAGARQSGGRAPEILAVRGLKARLEMLQQAGISLIALAPRTPGGLFPIEKERRVALVSGPEGGLTEGEYQVLEDHGARFVSLGTSILRAETAPIAALSALRLWDASERD